jgi:alcohol dehydrogenase class IV
MVRDAVESLNDAGVEVDLLVGAFTDLPVDRIEALLPAAAAGSPDSVIGLGGGSSLDLAKIIALRLSHPGSVDRYYGENQVPGPTIPTIALPTTSGTGSEVTPVAVVTDAARTLKVGISSTYLVPTYAICDQALTDACPAAVTAFAGIDALAHAIEAVTAVEREPEQLDRFLLTRVFVGKNPISELFALAAIQSMGSSLATAVRDPTDRRARDHMSYGSLLAGLAFASAGTSAAHALQYPLGARTSTPHGLGVGLLLPYVMEFNRPVREGEFAAIAAALGAATHQTPVSEAASAAIGFVADLCLEIGIPTSLRQIGVAEDDLPHIADAAAGVRRLVENNPRELNADALLSILRAAWAGDRRQLM